MSELFEAVEAVEAPAGRRGALPPPGEREGLRKAHGPTRERVAEALGVRRDTVVGGEAWRTEPRPSHRQAYIRLLDRPAALRPAPAGPAAPPVAPAPDASSAGPASAGTPAPAGPGACDGPPAGTAAGSRAKPQRPTRRPDIRAAVIASARVGTHRRMRQPAEGAGPHPVAVLSGCAVRLFGGPSPLDVPPRTPEGAPLPGGFRLGVNPGMVNPGMVRHEGTRPLPRAAEPLDAGHDPARRIRTGGAGDGEE